MKNHLTAGLLAAALTLGGLTATPVSADSEDTTKIIVGLAALALIGAAISSHNDREEEEEEREDERRRILPRECLAAYDTSDGRVALFGQQCLMEEYSYSARLPLTCAVTIRSRGVFYSGFAPQCLHDAGYRVSGQ